MKIDNLYKNALVTGGAGFIGSHLSRALLREGLEVKILDNLSMGKKENVPDDAEFIFGDVCSKGDVEKTLKGIEIVFHEAARVSIRSSIKEFYQDVETNLMGTVNLLRCCVGTGVKKIVFASSMAVYSDCNSPVKISENYTLKPISPYGISKLASEKYCLQFSKDFDIDCHVLRYFNTYGVGQTFTPYVGVITIFIKQLLNGETPKIFGDGEQRRDFTHVNDIVSANLLSMKSQIPRGIFNVGTGTGTSVNEIAALLCDKINPGIRPIHVEEHPGELRYSIADIHQIANDLSYNTDGKLAEKISDVIDYYKDKA